MSFLLKNQFHTSLAEAFYNDVLFRRSNYYYYMGKVIPWNTGDEPTEYIPDTVQDEVNIRNDIFALKRITASDVSLVVKRINWQVNTVYDMYDSSIDLSIEDFYVITDQFNVYKCIDNNLGAVSTVKPTGNSFETFKTSDGYIWKYMYTIPFALRNKFLTSEHIPVLRALTTNFYNFGAVSTVVIENEGSGYTGEPVVSLNVAGTGTGAELIPVVAQDSGEIKKVLIKNGGTGYTSATISIFDPNNSGTGKYPGNATAILEPILVGGVIVDVLIRDPGQDYSDNIQTTLEIQGDGQDARLTPFILDGKLVDVIIEDPGTGYTFIDVDVVGITGSGAKVRVDLGKGDLISDQATVEQRAIPGAVHAIKVVNGGTDYTQATVEITGDGTGLTAEALISGGVVRQIIVTNPGQNYSYCEARIVGNNQQNNPATAVDAELYAILPPVGGHGKNAVKELGAKTLILYTTINQDRFHDVLIDNDFRQYGILRNPTETFTSTTIRKTLATSCFLATIVDTTGLSNDDVLIGTNNKKLKVIQIANNGILLLPLNTVTLNNSEYFVKEGTNTGYQINEVLQPPEFNKFSGDLLYVSNNPGIDFSEEQLITLKTIIIL